MENLTKSIRGSLYFVEFSFGIAKNNYGFPIFSGIVLFKIFSWHPNEISLFALSINPMKIFSWIIISSCFYLDLGFNKSSLSGYTNLVVDTLRTCFKRYDIKWYKNEIKVYKDIQCTWNFVFIGFSRERNKMGKNMELQA